MSTRLHEIAEIMIRYRPVNGPGGWRIVNLESSTVLDARPADEAGARAAARLAAAGDICAFFEGSPAR